MRIQIAVALLLGVSAAFAQPASLKDAEKHADLERGIAAANKALLAVDEISAQRTVDCIKAFGHEPMCKCISENIPWMWTFAEYVAITTRTKEENSYTKLTKGNKAAYDKVVVVRDQCVRVYIK